MLTKIATALSVTFMLATAVASSSGSHTCDSGVITSAPGGCDGAIVTFLSFTSFAFRECNSRRRQEQVWKGPETIGQNRALAGPQGLQRPHSADLNRGNARRLRVIRQRLGNGSSYRTAWWAREAYDRIDSKKLSAVAPSQKTRIIP